LQGINANRVAALGWAAGTTLAGLAGILLAPTLRLQPYGFTFVVLGTMAVVVLARLTRPGVAVLAALAIGIGQAELTRVHLTGRGRALLEATTANLFVVALLLAVLVIARLDETGGADVGVTARLATRGELIPIRGWWIIPALTLDAPLLFGAQDLRTALAVPALAIVLVSIVVVSGYSGQISLGQAGFAGFGALLAGRLMTGTMPGLPRMSGVAVLVVVPILAAILGAATGWPAIRRRGLFLALTTFAVGAAMSRFVFDQPAVTNGVHVGPPDGFGSDNNFYILELACLTAAFLLVHNLHQGRLGRALIAVRDDEAGARASGIDVSRLKVLVFSAGSGLAGLGGALLAMGARAFDAGAFDPIRGLTWFAAVVVFGIDSAPGAVIGAGLITMLDATFPVGTSILVIGVGALLIGRLPGGLVHSIHRLVNHLLRRGSSPTRAAAIARPYRLTPTGQAVATRLAGARARAAGGPMVTR
jgi:branched-chain amino acid transport system permease protein